MHCNIQTTFFVHAITTTHTQSTDTKIFCIYIYRRPNLCVFQVRKISVDYPNAEDVLNLDDARKELAFARACFWQLSEYFNHSAITAMQVFVHICMLLFTILREESCFTPYFPRSDTCKSAVARAFAE